MKLKHTKKILGAFAKTSNFKIITTKGYTVLTQYKELDVLFYKNKNLITVNKPNRKKRRKHRTTIENNNQFRLIVKS